MGQTPPSKDYVPIRVEDRLLALIDEEARRKGSNRSAVIREVLWAALDPEKRRGEAYGYYLRSRDAEKARALLASLSLLVLTLGGWTLGLLLANPL